MRRSKTARRGSDPSDQATERRTLRCAVYTRKSTEEGLDQAFNSLDAQREACAAYILSQAGEGWTLVSTAFDDGGYSGGNLDRPGLQKLLTDIDAGRIDVVVVYKIDRLTRSLADFAKIVERLDARGASFVSVTQAFNTTTSMGRLTLNVLLSFAQFEREVGAERVRDKIAASRRKGIWMGGSPALGYDVKDRKLVPNEAEAETVRWMFKRYLEVGSLTRLRAEIEARGIRTKSYVSGSGAQRGGKRWYVGPLQYLLRNRVYVGDAVHKGKAWPGEHAPIVERSIFDAVQTAFSQSRVDRQAAIRTSTGMLTGLVWDDAGNRMSPQLAHRDGNRSYGYYVSQALLQRRPSKGSLPRVAVARLDALTTRVLKLLDLGAETEARELGAASTTQLEGAPQGDERWRIEQYVHRVEVGLKAVRLFLQNTGDLDTSTIPIVLPGTTRSEDEDYLALTIPISLARWTAGKKVEAANPGWTRRADRLDLGLVRNLLLAHRCRRRIEAGETKSIEAAGKYVGLSRNSTRQLLRLAWLAPDLQEAILDGRQPLGFDVGKVLKLNIPADWRSQKQALGLAMPVIGKTLSA